MFYAVGFETLADFGPLSSLPAVFSAVMTESWDAASNGLRR